MAILYGTQSNGETLPVLVDQFGNLLAKGIEGPPGPPGEPGEPGSAAFPPDPQEGDLLGYQNGEVAWISGLNPPVPTEDLQWMNPQEFKLLDKNSVEYDGPDKYEKAKTYPYWNVGSNAGKIGFEIGDGTDGTDPRGYVLSKNMTFASAVGFQDVFKLYVEFVYWQATADTGLFDWVVITSDPNVSLIGNTLPGSRPSQPGDTIVYVKGTVDMRVSQPIEQFNLRFGLQGSRLAGISTYIQGYQYESQGSYALSTQLKLKQEVTEMRALINQHFIGKS